MPQQSSRYHLLDERLTDHIAAADQEEQSLWLILSRHPDFRGRWIVECLYPYFQFDLEEIIGPYRAVSPARLAEFLDACEGLDYKVVFADDPTTILEDYEHLNDLPPFSLNSDLPGTVNGFLPWQIQGYNFLRGTDKGGLALWSTGAGKTVLMIALIKGHRIDEEFDIALSVVKPNNMTNTQRKMKQIANLDAEVISGDQERRLKRYAEADVTEGPQILITNYEKFRDDEPFMKMLFSEERRVLVFWDEMPTKLKNRGTQLYEAVCRCLYKSAPMVLWHRKRPRWLRQYQTTATPIENSPEDVFSTFRLQDPDLFPSWETFKAEFAAKKNYFNGKPEGWHKLDKLGLMIEHMVHQVDKNDPDIAKYFPKQIEDTKYADWTAEHRKYYDTLQTMAAEKDDFSSRNILALIGLMQMLCDMPSMVVDSAKRAEAAYEALRDSIELPEGMDEEDYAEAQGAAQALLKALGKRTLKDEGHPKLEALRELLFDRHPGAKTLIYTAYNEMLLPKLSAVLDEWGIKHVVYSGTDTQKQAAQDQFQSDPETLVFLSSDSGSDSLDLPEASVVIHYDLPWKWSTRIQRENRNHRVVTEHDTVYVYILMMPDSIEERKLEIIMTKKGYHDGVFKGSIADEAISARMTRADLLYILTGQWPD